MSYITVDVNIDISNIMDEISDDDLEKEMKFRGYSFSKDITEQHGVTQEDLKQLLEIIDSLPRNWETDRLRDKIFRARNNP